MTTRTFETDRRTGSTSSAGTSRDVTRAVSIIVAMVLALIGSAIGSGAFGGTPIQNASGGALSATSTLLAPGAPAFSIWSVIYTGLLVYAVYQALPGQLHRERHRRIGGLVVASLLLNAAWILAVQFDLLVLSVPMIVALLVVLVMLVFRLGSASGWVDRVIVDGTFGIYLGWVTIATVANVAAQLNAWGFRGFGIPAGVWAVVILAVAAAIGVLTVVRTGGRIAPALATSWGLSWIAIARATDAPSSTVTAIAATIAAVGIMVAAVGLKARALRHRTTAG